MKLTYKTNLYEENYFVLLPDGIIDVVSIM